MRRLTITLDVPDVCQDPNLPDSESCIHLMRGVVDGSVYCTLFHRRFDTRVSPLPQCIESTVHVFNGDELFDEDDICDPRR